MLYPLDVRFQMEQFEIAGHRTGQVCAAASLGDFAHARQMLRALHIEDRIGASPRDQSDDDARQELAPDQAHRSWLVDPSLQIRHPRWRDHVELPVRAGPALDGRDVDKTVTMQPSERRVDLPERQGSGTGEVRVVAMLQLVPVLRPFFQQPQQRVSERHPGRLYARCIHLASTAAWLLSTNDS